MKRYLITLFIIIGMPLAGWAQVLTGVITDAETKEPLIGASVRLEGLQVAAVADEDGHFMLNLPAGNQRPLLVSYIGYQKQSIPADRLKEGRLLKIQLKAIALDIQDVVVTGVYERKKESFTGSASTYSGKELRMLGAQNVLKNLSIIDPSFRINENTLMGSNPNTMPNIEVRGKTSIVGLQEEFGRDPNQPLFILDGFETDIQTVMDLNMNRVQSITILKDAASTAIYGSKAANGVVVIETVRPEHGRLRLNYKGDYGLTWADLTSYNLMNASEKMHFEELAGLYRDGTGNYMSQLMLDNLHNERVKEIARGVDTYWLSEPTRMGFDQKHNIYAEGGEEKIRYGIGITYGNTQGVLEQSFRKTAGMNMDLIYRTGIFQFSNKFVLNNVKTSDPTIAFSEYAQANPYYRKYNQDGGIDKYLYYPDNDYDTPVGNPLYNSSLNSYNRSKALGFTDHFMADAFITDYLRARVKMGITHTGTTGEVHVSPLDTRFDSAKDTERGSHAFSQEKQLRYEADASVTFGKLFADIHTVNLVGGINFSHNKSTRDGYTSTGFTEDAFDAPSFSNKYTENGKPVYNESTRRSASYYLNGGYQWRERYLLDANWRYDGSSVFGSENRFRHTWSVGLGWNMHKEKWMEKLTAEELFTLLKIRSSLGNPGNQNFSAYQSITTYQFVSSMSNVFGSGVLFRNIGNPNLRWQNTLNWTLGVDVEAWHKRISLSADYFIKNTDPLLANITTPGSLGVKNTYMNLGGQLTKGVETMIRITPINDTKRQMNWNISMNMRHYLAEYRKIGHSLDALNEANKLLPNELTRYYDGGSPTAIWGVRSAGIDPATGKEIFIKKDGSYTFNYSTDDEVVLGDTRPKLEGTLGTNFYWRGLTVGVYLSYQLGGQVFNSDLFNKVENVDFADINYNQDRRALYDRWSPDNTEARFKGISLVQTTDKSSRFVMDRNTLQGTSFLVSYQFPKQLITPAKLSALTLQCNMNDIFYWSTVKQERGIAYPYARTVSFTLSASF